MWGTYVCNEINIVRLGFKKQPKLTKEQPFVKFCKFVKNSRHMIRTKFSTVILNHIEVVSKTPYDSNENIYNLFPLCGGPMCALLITTYGWDLRNIAENDQGSARCELFHFFFENCRYDSTEIFYRQFILNGEPTWAMTLIL